MPNPKRPASETLRAAHCATGPRFLVIRPIPNPTTPRITARQKYRANPFSLPTQTNCNHLQPPAAKPLPRAVHAPSTGPIAPLPIGPLPSHHLKSVFTRRTHFPRQPKQNPATYPIRREPVAPTRSHLRSCGKSRPIRLRFPHISRIKMFNSFVLSMAPPVPYHFPKEKSL